jgi:iron complex outermembrane receptor protein
MAASDRIIEEIVVTSQRISESIQDVPIAVTALTGEMLVERQVINPSAFADECSQCELYRH